MTIYPQIAAYNRVVTVDIGGFTLDYLLLREGRPDLSVCDSLEKGVITLYNRIISRVSSDFDMLLEDTDIDTIILGKNSDYSDSVIRLVKQMTKQYVDDFLGAFKVCGSHVYHQTGAQRTIQFHRAFSHRSQGQTSRP